MQQQILDDLDNLKLSRCQLEGLRRLLMSPKAESVSKVLYNMAGDRRYIDAIQAREKQAKG